MSRKQRTGLSSVWKSAWSCSVLAVLVVLPPGCEPDSPGVGPDAATDATLQTDAAGDARPDVSLIDATTDDAATDDAATGDAATDDAATGDAATDDAATGDAATGDAAVGSDGGCPDGGGAPPTCPADMVLVSGTYCIDIWEASRPDATALSPGVDDSFAVSAPDRMPWWSSVLTPGEADLACQAACKRLCTASEWQTACQGPTQTVYGYGDVYAPATCNGIDTRCNCAHATCAAEPTCPYAFCWSQCGGMFHVDATGSSPGCVNGYGVYDMNGNVWEVVDAPDQYPFRGGAFNCANSQSNHRCDFVPTWNISAKGFRCCQDPL